MCFDDVICRLQDATEKLAATIGQTSQRFSFAMAVPVDLISAVSNVAPHIHTVRACFNSFCNNDALNSANGNMNTQQNHSFQKLIVFCLNGVLLASYRF
jgi:hypothetical protein